MDGQHLELRGWTAPEMTIEQAKQAGRAAARKQLSVAAEYPPTHPVDAYDALRLYVTLEGDYQPAAPHSLLGDVFCDAYDDEIDMHTRRWER